MSMMFWGKLFLMIACGAGGLYGLRFAARCRRENDEFGRFLGLTVTVLAASLLLGWK